MDTPALKHLMGAYFHQDFAETHGGPWQTISAFLSGEPGLAVTLCREIEMVLRALPAETDVERYLDELGCEYWPGPEESGYRGWLTELAAYASAWSGRPGTDHERACARLLDDLEELYLEEDLICLYEFSWTLRGAHMGLSEAQIAVACEEVYQKIRRRIDLILVEVPWPPDVSSAVAVDDDSPLDFDIATTGAPKVPLQALLRRSRWRELERTALLRPSADGEPDQHRKD